MPTRLAVVDIRVLLDKTFPIATQSIPQDINISIKLLYHVKGET